jgi:hypothetical protein
MEQVVNGSFTQQNSKQKDTLQQEWNAKNVVLVQKWGVIQQLKSLWGIFK